MEETERASKNYAPMVSWTPTKVHKTFQFEVKGKVPAKEGSAL